MDTDRWRVGGYSKSHDKFKTIFPKIYIFKEVRNEYFHTLLMIFNLEENT